MNRETVILIPGEGVRSWSQNREKKHQNLDISLAQKSNLHWDQRTKVRTRRFRQACMWTRSLRQVCAERQRDSQDHASTTNRRGLIVVASNFQEALTNQFPLCSWTLLLGSAWSLQVSAWCHNRLIRVFTDYSPPLIVTVQLKIARSLRVSWSYQSPHSSTDALISCTSGWYCRGLQGICGWAVVPEAQDVAWVKSCDRGDW